MLACIDILGPPILFKIEKKENLKTSEGGVLTLVACFIFIGVFFGFGRDLFSRKVPRIIYNKEVNEKASHEVTHTNFLYAIYDQSTDKPFEELERKFTSYVDFYRWFGNGTRTVKRAFMEKCTQEAIDRWEGSFKNIKSNYFCLPKNSTFDITGIYNEGKYTSMRLQVDFCQNNTGALDLPHRTNCYSRDFIEKNITGRVQMHMILESIKIDSLNYDKPVTVVAVSDISTNTNTNSWNRLRLFYKNVEISSDAGFLLEEWNTQIYNSVDTVTTETVYTLGTSTIFSHLIGNAKYKEIYNRRYIKVQDIFALMGGFINATLLILRYVVKHLTNPRLIDIFNYLYKFHPIEVHEKELVAKKISSKLSSSLKNNSNADIKEIPLDNTNINEKPKMSVENTNSLMNSKDFNNNSIIRKDPKDNSICNRIEADNSSLRLNNSNKQSQQLSKHDFIVSKLREKKAKNYSLNIKPINMCCIPCYSRKPLNKHKLMLLDTVQRQFDKVLSIEKYLKIAREIKFYRYLFLDKEQKKFLKLCEVQRSEFEDKNDFEKYYESNVDVLIKNKNKCRKLNKKILDLVCDNINKNNNNDELGNNKDK